MSLGASRIVWAVGTTKSCTGAVKILNLAQVWWEEQAGILYSTGDLLSPLWAHVFLHSITIMTMLEIMSKL